MHKLILHQSLYYVRFKKIIFIFIILKLIFLFYHSFFFFLQMHLLCKLLRINKYISLTYTKMFQPFKYFIKTVNAIRDTNGNTVLPTTHKPC